MIYEYNDYGRKVDVRIETYLYPNMRLGVKLIDIRKEAINKEDALLKVATLFISDENIGREEIIVRNLADNHGMLEFLQHNSIILGVNRVIKMDRVSLPVCDINKKLLLETCPEAKTIFNGIIKGSPIKTKSVS